MAGIERNLPYIFYALIGCHFINCYSRADYNLPLYILMYLTWCENSFTDFNKKTFIVKEMKLYSYVSIALTGVIDIFWFLFYRSENQNLVGFESSMFKFCYVLSIILFVCKIGIAILLGMSDKQLIKENMNKEFLAENFGTNIQSNRISSDIGLVD